MQSDQTKVVREGDGAGAGGEVGDVAIAGHGVEKGDILLCFEALDVFIAVSDAARIVAGVLAVEGVSFDSEDGRGLGSF